MKRSAGGWLLVYGLESFSQKIYQILLLGLCFDLKSAKHCIGPSNSLLCHINIVVLFYLFIYFILWDECKVRWGGGVKRAKTKAELAISFLFYLYCLHNFCFRFRPSFEPTPQLFWEQYLLGKLSWWRPPFGGLQKCSKFTFKCFRATNSLMLRLLTKDIMIDIIMSSIRKILKDS